MSKIQQAQPVNREALTRYSTAVEYIEAIKMVFTSAYYQRTDKPSAIRPTHLLFGFALELYLKAWLLADGMPTDQVQKQGHKLLNLYNDASSRGFAKDDDIRQIIHILAKPHGQNRDYVYRYTEVGGQVPYLELARLMPVIEKLDRLVDFHVGASASRNLAPGRWTIE